MGLFEVLAVLGASSGIGLICWEAWKHWHTGKARLYCRFNWELRKNPKSVIQRAIVVNKGSHDAYLKCATVMARPVGQQELRFEHATMADDEALPVAAHGGIREFRFRWHDFPWSAEVADLRPSDICIVIRSTADKELLRVPGRAFLGKLLEQMRTVGLVGDPPE